jgi:hypothetical protein
MTLNVQVRAVGQGLNLFNENWGPAGDPPKLSRDEFLTKILLESIAVGNDGGLEFFCSDSALFAGHHVVFYCRSDGEIKGPDLFG